MLEFPICNTSLLEQRNLKEALIFVSKTTTCPDTIDTEKYVPISWWRNDSGFTCEVLDSRDVKSFSTQGLVMTCNLLPLRWAEVEILNDLGRKLVELLRKGNSQERMGLRELSYRTFYRVDLKCQTASFCTITLCKHLFTIKQPRLLELVTGVNETVMYKFSNTYG